MEQEADDLIEMTITGVQEGKARNGYQSITLTTNRGNLECRYYPARRTRTAVIWVGGIGGGYDSPARELYPHLCRELKLEGIASLRMRYRHPRELEEAVLDVLAGITYLEGEGIDTLALVGHSIGGAVVIQAAAQDDSVRTVVTLATQNFGTAPVSRLGPRCSILLIHGTDDETLPPSSSEHVYQRAHEPKELVLHQGARHNLEEAAEEIRRAVHDWIVRWLKEAEGQK